MFNESVREQASGRFCLTIAFPAALMIASKLHDFSGWSMSALGLSSTIVILAALAAAGHPARRALRIQPAEIVRAE